VGACSHLVEAGQIGNQPQVRDAARMRDRGANVVDELLLDQIFAVPNAVENFAHCQRRGGVLPDEFEGCLVFCGRRVFQPKQMKRLDMIIT